MFEVIKVFVPSLKWKVIPFRTYFWEERVGEVTAIFRVVAIVFIAASEVRDGFKKSKWKFKMAFAMKGGVGLEGVSSATYLF